VTDLAAVVAALRSARRVLVAVHEMPDGDTTGSALALALVLQRLGKETQVGGPDPLPPSFQFLPGAASAVTWDAVAPGTRFDVVVTVDCGAASRAGGERRLRSLAPVLVNIDHHATNPRFGDLNWVEPEWGAVGEMILALADALEVPLDPDIALCLYVSLASDTEGFRFGVHDSRFFRLAARLIEAGLDPAAVNHRLFEEQPLSTLRLKGWALLHLQRSPSGKVAWLLVPRQVMARYGARLYESEGLVSLVRSLEGVQMAMLAREEEPGWVKVSLRSQPPWEAGAVAERLGGGGHVHSAAAKVRGSLRTVSARVLSLIEQLYGEDARWTDSSTS
jgi:phosphoesterase RecJ-like protein